MGITKLRRDQRRKYIGSSDMPAILGVDPWRNIYDVFMEKTGQIEEWAPGLAAQAGIDLESGVLAFAERELGRLIRNQFRSLPELHLGASIDAVVYGSGLPVEAKTAGITGPLPESWGEAGTDDVPDRVIVQAHVHMMCLKNSNVHSCHVPTLLGGRGLLMFEVHKDKKLCRVIAEAAGAFWDRVEMRKPPEGVMPHLEVVKCVRRQPNKTVEVSREVMAGWLMAKAKEKSAIGQRKAAEARLLAAMGDAERATSEEGGAVTYFEQARKGYTVEPTTFRVLRHKQPQALPKPRSESKNESESRTETAIAAH